MPIKTIDSLQPFDEQLNTTILHLQHTMHHLQQAFDKALLSAKHSFVATKGVVCWPVNRLVGKFYQELLKEKKQPPTERK